jgi:hypothetical protein
MFAGIQSVQFSHYIRIKETPVLEFDNCKVYELIDSTFPNDMVKKVNGRYAGTFRHVALHMDGNGYLFDIQNNELAGSMGSCHYVAD